MKDKFKTLKEIVILLITLVAVFKVLWLLFKVLPDQKRMKELQRLREAMQYAHEKKSVRKIRDYLLRKL